MLQMWSSVFIWQTSLSKDGKSKQRGPSLLKCSDFQNKSQKRVSQILK